MLVGTAHARAPGFEDHYFHGLHSPICEAASRLWWANQSLCSMPISLQKFSHSSQNYKDIYYFDRLRSLIALEQHEFTSTRPLKTGRARAK